MSWFQVSIKPVDARKHASPAEILECFRNENSLLRKLAFLVTGDLALADQSVAKARESTLKGCSIPRLASGMGQVSDG